MILLVFVCRSHFTGYWKLGWINCQMKLIAKSIAPFSSSNPSRARKIWWHLSLRITCAWIRILEKKSGSSNWVYLSSFAFCTCVAGSGWGKLEAAWIVQSMIVAIREVKHSCIGFTDVVFFFWVKTNDGKIPCIMMFATKCDIIADSNSFLQNSHPKIIPATPFKIIALAIMKPEWTK